MSTRRWSRAKAGAAVAQCLIAVLLHGAPSVCAQQLSVRHYDVRDGLAQNSVLCIYQDAKGYLWFGTGEGISRFDGYRFTTYDTRDGLRHSYINDIVEDQQGRLWVATNGGGVARLIDDPQESVVSGRWSVARDEKQRTTDNGQRTSDQRPATTPKFVSYGVGDWPGSNNVNALLFDTNNTLWCATDAGLCRAVGRGSQANDLKFELVAPRKQKEFLLQTAFSDLQGNLWFGVADGLIQVVQGQVIKYGLADEVGRQPIIEIVEAPQGNLLVAHRQAVFELIKSAEVHGRGRWKKLPLVLKPDQLIYSIATDATGALWLGTSKGLIKYTDGRQADYTTAHGLASNRIRAVLTDREGDLWLGTAGAGVGKLSGEHIVSFTPAEGLPDQVVTKIIEDREGRIYASTQRGGVVEVVEGKIVPVPGSQRPPFNTIGRRILCDRRGDWWVGTDEGVFRFRGPKLRFHQGQKFTSAEPISSQSIREEAGGVEDQTGKIWFVTRDEHLVQFDPARKAGPVLKRIPIKGIPPGTVVIQTFRDRYGRLWLGSHDWLGRLKEDRLLVFQPTEGLPETRPRAFFEDSRGWLWIGLRYEGVSLTTDPTAEPPKLVNYSTRNGLASGSVRTITEDDFGRIYLGTARGLDQLDPATGQIRHFTTRDGLAGDVIEHLLKDRRGNIWIATSTGLSRYDPRAERAVKPPPPIYLSRVQVAGKNLPLPETGASHVPALRLSAEQRNLRLEYVGLSFQGEQALRYQYRLEGVDADWSPPTEERSVNYAGLSPGTYRFLVRAVNSDGRTSPTPATIAFTILPPLWQRWWFVALVVAAMTVGAFALHRARVQQLLALERIRRRVARDLHDEIGSGLSQVAILSEVTKRDAPPAVGEALDEVATLARTMQDSMSDIVWTVDPRKDHLADAVQRMRQAAFNLLEAEGRRVEYQIPNYEELERIGLTPDRRRHVLLIFKEVVTNIARHAQANHVRVEMKVDKRVIRLTISDDGQGFDPQAQYEGHGLQSLRERAAELKGDLEIESAPGRGTTVRVTIPVK